MDWEVPLDAFTLAQSVCSNGRNGCLSSSVFFLLRSTAVRNAVRAVRGGAGSGEGKGIERERER